MPKPIPRSSLDELVQQNVEAIQTIELAKLSRRTRADVIVDAIAAFCGNLGFVYVHVVLFGLWIVLNMAHGVPDSLRFDPPPFGMLTLIVALEAIFLSAFILISQNRQQKVADQRNHLDLQINLLAEQESSQMLIMLDQIMEHLGIANSRPPVGLSEDTDPIKVAARIDDVTETV